MFLMDEHKFKSVLNMKRQMKENLLNVKEKLEKEVNMKK